MCQVLQVSKSAYYRWSKGIVSARRIRRDFLKKEIRRVYVASKCRYGSPRITKELKMHGVKVSQPLIAKLMREEQIRSIVRKKHRITTDSKHNFKVAGNMLNREFTVYQPNKVWVSDITYVSTREGWLYLTTIIDLFDRKVIGWALSETLRTKNTSISAFKMATTNRPLSNSGQLIFHSDRGVQYACDEFRLELEKYSNIARSMSRKANCWDNAVAESFFKTIKSELIYHYSYQNKHEAALSIFEYIETWYNKNRRHKQLNNLTIDEFQKSVITNLKNAA